MTGVLDGLWGGVSGAMSKPIECAFEVGGPARPYSRSPYGQSLLQL